MELYTNYNILMNIIFYCCQVHCANQAVFVPKPDQQTNGMTSGAMGIYFWDNGPWD